MEIQKLKTQLEEAKRIQQEAERKIKELEEKEEELRLKGLPLLDRVKEKYEDFGWYEIKADYWIGSDEFASELVEDSFKSNYDDGTDHQSVVRFFPNLNAYFQFFGYYTSYNGDELLIYKTIQVYPKIKTVTIFETQN